MNRDLTAPWEDVADMLNITPSLTRTQHDPQCAALAIIEYLKRRLTAVSSANPRPLGLLLSGGVDSAVLAAVAVAIGLAPMCVTVVAEDSANTDEEAATAVAASLGLCHEVIRLDQTDILRLTKFNISALETDELWDIGAAIITKAAFDFFNQSAITGPILVGQGADVIFAGGQRLDHCLSSFEALSELDDLLRLHVSNCFTKNRHLPDYFQRFLGPDANRFIKVFQTIEAWELSQSLTPTALWVEHNGLLHDKACLRNAAEMLGLPLSVAWREKSPSQTSSGVFEALYKLSAENLVNWPGAMTYTDPRTESPKNVATRYFLKSLRGRI